MVKLLILGIYPLTSFILALRVVLVAKLVTSFFTTLLGLLKSTGTGANLSIVNLSTSLFKLLELVGTFLICANLLYLLKL